MTSRSFRWFISFCFSLTTVFLPAADPRAAAAECSNAYLAGMAPLTDLGASTYKGEVGGLYPGGSNQVPSGHLALGTALAGQITPLSSTGQASSSGKIAFISVGVSNTSGEFSTFIKQGDALRAPAVVVVNGAQSGEPINSWIDPNARTWDVVDGRLAASGVTPAQVQAAWVKLPEKNPTEAFPTDATTYAEDLAAVVRNLKTNYPNIRIAYISSRVYGGYGTELNPEPWAYQNGFGVKLTIEAQIFGDPALNSDASKGSIVAPWIAWGPYMWANGAGPDFVADGVPGREDGLEWLCSDFAADGIHPSDAGASKVAAMLLAHLHSDPTACGWYLMDQSACAAPGPIPVPAGVFLDIAGSEFAADILWLAEQGITNGCNPAPNPLFCPNGLVTRGQMAAFLTRALSLPNGPDIFTDDETSIFEADINALARAGITLGCNPPANTLFCPDDSVTRGQMAAFLTRALSLPNGPDIFTDDEISIFEADINALARARITLGCNPPANNSFCPDDSVTRGQMAAFLHRAEAMLP